MRSATAPIAIAVVVVLLAGCGGSSPAALRTETRRAAPLHVVGNATAHRLRSWAARLRACYRERELRPSRVSVAPRRLLIGVDPSVAPSILAGETLACVSTLGKPPAHASFRTRRGRAVISLPSGYRLDTRDR
jgi:hypothetical protein